jgi:hypothetical protein
MNGDHRDERVGIAVYPRLSELLRAKDLTVAELGRQIEQRFGLSVDPKTLYRLTHVDAVQQSDLEIAGAVAAVLEIDLGDLFDVRALPVNVGGQGTEAELGPEQSRRLAELFDRHARDSLTAAERQELEGLVSDNGRRLHEQRLREIAEQRSIGVERAVRLVVLA